MTPLPSIISMDWTDTNLSLTPLPSIISMDWTNTNLSLTPLPSISLDVSDDRETSRFVPQTKHPTDFWFAFIGNVGIIRNDPPLERAIPDSQKPFSNQYRERYRSFSSLKGLQV